MPLVLIGTSVNLQVSRTGIKSRTISNFATLYDLAKSCVP